MAHNIKSIPASVSDVLLHMKETDNCCNGDERVILPITRYDNVMSAPNVVSSPTEVAGAPFLLLRTGADALSVEDIRKLCGDII